MAPQHAGPLHHTARGATHTSAAPQSLINHHHTALVSVTRLSPATPPQPPFPGLPHRPPTTLRLQGHPRVPTRLVGLLEEDK
ncbi:hypothetical protein E2C01_027946 [Portunus trituberculatus]|uniref:Uncharacterized protein n=1 Tax=Portunus trituberculatus TaxID=210409 RepID=A0A5B7ENK1_PORTR|nr:hypothetical protein [Portunus trituberculatus]